MLGDLLFMLAKSLFYNSNNTINHHSAYPLGWLHWQHWMVRVGLVPRRPCHQGGVISNRSTFCLDTLQPALDYQPSSLFNKHEYILFGYFAISSVLVPMWSANLALWQQYNLQSLAEKYGKMPAQLVLRWGLQRNTVVIPMTSKAQ